MLPRHLRLPVTIRTRPLSTTRTPYFTAKLFSHTLAYPRFGFVVSKKVSPKAVARNRVKRQFRDSIQALLPQIRGGCDILFIVQKDALDVETASIQRAVADFLNSKHLLT